MFAHPSNVEGATIAVAAGVDVLAHTNSAGWIQTSLRLGRVAPGYRADLTVLKGDPAVDITAFAHVRYTLRDGRVIFSATRLPRGLR